MKRVLRCDRFAHGRVELGVYESGFSEWGHAGDAVVATAVAETLKTRAEASLNDDETAVDAVLRLSLLPENLLVRPWKVKISAVAELERAIVRGGTRGSRR